MTQLDRIENKIDELTKNLADPKEGVYVRIDRIEQRQIRREWWLYIILVCGWPVSILMYAAKKLGITF